MKPHDQIFRAYLKDSNDVIERSRSFAEVRFMLPQRLDCPRWFAEAQIKAEALSTDGHDTKQEAQRALAAALRALADQVETDES